MGSFNDKSLRNRCGNPREGAPSNPAGRAGASAGFRLFRSLHRPEQKVFRQRSIEIVGDIYDDRVDAVLFFEFVRRLEIQAAFLDRRR